LTGDFSILILNLVYWNATYETNQFQLRPGFCPTILRLSIVFNVIKKFDAPEWNFYFLELFVQEKIKKMESIIINQVIVGCRFEHALEAPEPQKKKNSRQSRGHTGENVSLKMYYGKTKGEPPK
jgi:hypothetical protein